MEQVVYGDILWLIDFSMDLLALGAAARMTGRPTRPWRLCGAAAFGGLYAVLILFLSLRGLWRVAMDLGAAVLMVLMAFGVSSFPRFLLTVGSFGMMSLLLGGGMTALCSWVSGIFGPGQGGGSAGGFFFIVLCGSGISLLWGRLRRRALPAVLPLTLRLGERELSLDALRDSGNLVRDPVSGRGVIFLEARALRRLCGTELARVLIERRVEKMASLPAEDARRLCLIPADTVQGRTLLIALRADSVSIGGEACDCLICPAQTPLPPEYAAIVPQLPVGISILPREQAQRKEKV